jgi:hypothetical protein
MNGLQYVTEPVPPSAQRLLFVRLPCNPIFPVGPIYLADHLHKQFPGLQQRCSIWRRCLFLMSRCAAPGD